MGVPNRSGLLLLPVLLVLMGGGAFSIHGQSYKDNPLLLDIAPNPVAAYDFESENLAGEPIRLSDFRGKVVFLNFWATWCVPCLMEMPSMDRLNKKLEGRPFKMLAVNQSESQEKIENFIKQKKFNFSFELVMDRLGEIGNTYSVDRLPLSYIIDEQGRVIRRAIGPREWDSQDAIDLFNQLMADIPHPKNTAGDPLPLKRSGSLVLTSLEIR